MRGRISEIRKYCTQHETKMHTLTTKKNRESEAGLTGKEASCDPVFRETNLWIENWGKLTVPINIPEMGNLDERCKRTKRFDIEI